MLLFACSAISTSEGGAGGEIVGASLPTRDEGKSSSAAVIVVDLISSGGKAGAAGGSWFPSSRCRLFSRISSAESSAPSPEFPEGFDESGESLFRRKVNMAANTTARIVASVEAITILFAIRYRLEKYHRYEKRLMHSPSSLSMNSMREYRQDLPDSYDLPTEDF